MLKGRPPKARPKPLATYEQNRDMYGFMVRPQHLEKYREYAAIYKEEEEERSDRWEQFLTTINENVTSEDISCSEATHKRGYSSDSEYYVTTGASTCTEAEKGAAKLWGQLRKSLWAIERATSISGRGLGSSSTAREFAATWNGATSSSCFAVTGDNNQAHESQRGASDTDTAVRSSVNGVLDKEESPGGSTQEGSGDVSEDEFCDASESTDTPHDGEKASPLTIANVDSPWEEELRFLVRGGVPMALRGELWQVFVGTKTRRAHGHYNALLTLLADGGGDGDGVGGLLDGSSSAAANYLVSETGVRGVLEKWTSQIEKDLPRTFPGHPALDEDGRNTLRRLLTAYARHNPSVGYCQAMNFLAALLLLLMPEENAFWTLTGIIDDYFEGYYAEKMVEAQVDQLVFEDLVREQFPKLVNHLDTLEVQVAWVSGPWFLSIFVNVLPWESVLRVWDVLLYEGNRCMLFRTGLALVEIHAPALSVTRDAGDAVALLQSMASATFDSSQLVLMACMGFQTVTENRLQEFRLKRRPEVLAALQERSMELDLWRSSNSSITQNLPYLYDMETSIRDSISVPQPVDNTPKVSADTPQFDDMINGHVDEDLCGRDFKEQVTWLKNELSQALDQKKAAVHRAKELEIALVEMVQEDNRRFLSAKVEKLEAEVHTLRQLLADKKDQEQALVQVLVRMEQEQKISDDARRFAELDSTAQRRAAEVFQEKYEGATDALAEMEKRTVMAETMLEATLSYQALGSSPIAPGSFGRRLTDPSSGRTPDRLDRSSSLSNHQNGSHALPTQDSEEKTSKAGNFNDSFGLNWRDRSKARSGNVDFPSQTSFSEQGQGSKTTLEAYRP